MALSEHDNNLEPYPYRITETNEFRFTAESGNIYYIYLLEYWQQDVVWSFSNTDVKIYEFNFEVERLNKISQDNRIAITIFSIIEDYLRAEDCVVYYVTQRMDGRAKQLFRLYQLWYTAYCRLGKKMSESVVKIDRVVESYGFIDAYVSSMVPNECFGGVERAERLMDKVLLEIFPNSSVHNF
jgi:hypothetical protein